jgi:hypothetical protein
MINPLLLVKLMRTSGALDADGFTEVMEALGIEGVLSEVKGPSDMPELPPGAKIMKFEMGQKGVRIVSGLIFVHPYHDTPALGTGGAAVSKEELPSGIPQPVYNLA